MKGMARLGNWLRLAALIGSAALSAALIPSAAAGVNTPEPTHAKAKANQCIKDSAYMIRHHPDLLKHQRDDTLRRGIRTSDYSLKRCMECHAGETTGQASSAHAQAKTDCDSCHAYAAVKLDCWDCHAKKPAKPKAKPVQAAQPSPMTSSVQPEGSTQ